MEGIAEIIFTELDGLDGKLGLITLNRPQALNALNHLMFKALNQLQSWEDDDNITAVIIRGEGRAFCAGGDMRAAYQQGLKKDPELKNYFGDEYRMNSRVYHFSKPYIALLDGITMGGGAGVSIYGSHRIATNNLVFAMPETGIGFFPDIGASYFLSRLPHRLGFYLGLTGASITAADCLALGLIDQVVARESFEKIISKLQVTELLKHPDAAVAEVIRHFEEAVPKSELMVHQMEIETCFSKDTVEDILETLERYPTAWCEEVFNNMALKSPTSLKVTLRELQLAEKLSFDQALGMEYKLMCHFIQGHDLYEGVRAALIDKDKKPVWKPNRVEDVSDDVVASYFSD
jgi:enoyl-CoA hydratase/carnithine racemase